MQTVFLGVAPLLQAYDMPRVVRFYRDVLGFELINQSRDGDVFDWCALPRGGLKSC